MSKKTLLVIVAALAQFLLFGTANANAAPPPELWNFPVEFNTTTNPGPDHAGRPNVWTYLEAPTATRDNPATYTAYTVHNPGSVQDCWTSPAQDAGFVPKRRNMHYEILGDPVFLEKDVPRMLALATARAEGDRSVPEELKKYPARSRQGKALRLAQ